MQDQTRFWRATGLPYHLSAVQGFIRTQRFVLPSSIGLPSFLKFSYFRTYFFPRSYTLVFIYSLHPFLCSFCGETDAILWTTHIATSTVVEMLWRKSWVVCCSMRQLDLEHKNYGHVSFPRETQANKKDTKLNFFLDLHTVWDIDNSRNYHLYIFYYSSSTYNLYIKREIEKWGIKVGEDTPICPHSVFSFLLPKSL